jgi:hypothetical protein
MNGTPKAPPIWIDQGALTLQLPTGSCSHANHRSTLALVRGYGKCNVAAYQDTPAELTVQVAGVEVLPNRKLKKFLPPLMEATATRLRATLFQKPDTIVESEPEVYIAKVARTPASRSRWPGLTPAPPRVPEMAVPSLRDHAEDLLAESLGIAVDRDRRSTPDPRLYPAISAAELQLPIDHFEADIVVSGVGVTEVRGVGCSVELLRRGGGALVRIAPETQHVEFPRTVLIRFADGAGAAVATPNGFLCNVIVDYCHRRLDFHLKSAV